MGSCQGSIGVPLVKVLVMPQMSKVELYAAILDRVSGILCVSPSCDLR